MQVICLWVQFLRTAWGCRQLWVLRPESSAAAIGGKHFVRLQSALRRRHFCWWNTVRAPRCFWRRLVVGEESVWIFRASIRTSLDSDEAGSDVGRVIQPYTFNGSVSHSSAGPVVGNSVGLWSKRLRTAGPISGTISKERNCTE